MNMSLLGGIRGSDFYFFFYFFFFCGGGGRRRYLSGFTFTLEIRENLEKELTFFQSGKAQGI